jgi:hypothetical protein
MLSTYFGEVGDNLDLALAQPIEESAIVIKFFKNSG